MLLEWRIFNLYANKLRRFAFFPFHYLQLSDLVRRHYQTTADALSALSCVLCFHTDSKNFEFYSVKKAEPFIQSALQPL